MPSGEKGGGVAGEELVPELAVVPRTRGVGRSLDGVLAQKRKKGRKSSLTGTSPSTLKSEKDSFMMTMRFSGRVPCAAVPAA